VHAADRELGEQMLALDPGTTTVSSSCTTLASACRAAMAQKMHRCAADAAF
jgi:hypothetical protein